MLKWPRSLNKPDNQEPFPISLPYTGESVLQVLKWGAAPTESPYSHKQIAEWCDRFWCEFIDVDAPLEIEKLLPILTDVETQWDLHSANLISSGKTKSDDNISMPTEWFEEWLAQAIDE